MELHSYAKRRTTPKKWTVEQKRKLVATRIAYEKLFSQNPRGSMLPWKKVLSSTNLDDYNVYFVRKQWSNMVAKYKQYKENRLGNIPTQAIDSEMIRTISQEWEFFAPIHDYMMCKTRNLHSYALQHDEEPILEANSNSNSNSTISSNECINTMMYSSDTNDATSVHMKSELLECATIPNTDHDFYSKKLELNKNNDNEVEVQNDVENKLETAYMETETLQQQPHHLINEVIITSTQQQQQKTKNEVSAKKVTIKMSERDRYYRHKRRFNRRIERRFDAILQVVGQVVKAEYPSIDVSPLMSVANAAKDLGTNLHGQIFSSADEFDDDESADENNVQNVWHAATR